jgi:hypothetical protein
MTSREVFRLIVAALGLYVFYLGASDLIAAVLDTLQLYESPYPRGSGARYLCVRGLIHLVLGTLLIAGFFPLENLAFPKPKDDDDEETEKPENGAGD